ncbi:RING-H2 FINGER PROTEIN ATL61-RELATED-RELATED [Salix purpurea]|uniref:RING-type E3 ubiquitin transferase n=1 Tax=Salix purpurea TaxID=77065 RepID=A0A9Q0VAC2_SALPP|nr:RING-H2 FINGER PROTEIN ATL61-RELATED-RELATED [Salix purpurea]
MEAWCQRRFLSGDATDRIKQAMQTSVLYRPHRFLLGMDSGMAPDSHGGRNSSDYILDSDESLESNMVIVLVGLICAFVCALGINSIARCAIRYGYRIGFETPHQAASRLAAGTSTGVKKSALGQIPVVTYESGLNIQVTGCTICLGEFSDGEKNPDAGPADSIAQYMWRWRNSKMELVVGTKFPCEEVLKSLTKPNKAELASFFIAGS